MELNKKEDNKYSDSTDELSGKEFEELNNKELNANSADSTDSDSNKIAQDSDTA